MFASVGQWAEHPIPRLPSNGSPMWFVIPRKAHLVHMVHNGHLVDDFTSLFADMLHMIHFLTALEADGHDRQLCY